MSHVNTFDACIKSWEEDSAVLCLMQVIVTYTHIHIKQFTIPSCKFPSSQNTREATYHRTDKLMDSGIKIMEIHIWSMWRKSSILSYGSPHLNPQDVESSICVFPAPHCPTMISPHMSAIFTAVFYFWYVFCSMISKIRYMSVSVMCCICEAFYVFRLVAYGCGSYILLMKTFTSWLLDNM